MKVFERFGKDHREGSMKNQLVIMYDVTKSNDNLLFIFSKK